MESIGTAIKGIYRDILKDTNDRLVSDSGWNNNTILNGCRLLLAGFMKNDIASGIQYLAVGQGQEAWDLEGAPAPDPATTTVLENRAYPSIPFSALEVVFLDSTDNIILEPSSRLQITATLAPGFPAPIAVETTYPLREFGLFGQLGTSEFMINNIRHPVLHKDENATLIRIMRLYF